MTDRILILDFGSQVTQRIARRVRENGVIARSGRTRRARRGSARSAQAASSSPGGPASVTLATTPRAPDIVFAIGVPAQLVNEFLQQLKLQQLRLKTDLRMNPATKSLAEDKSLARNARLLETLDRLSLYFCLNSPEDATIEGVPLNGDGGEVDWQLRHGGDLDFSLDPYPFRKDPLPFSILARRVPKRLYGDESDFHKTLARAPFFAVNFTLRAGGAADQTRSAVA